MYIGQQPVVGRYILLDQISGGFNGTTSGFTMSTAGGVQGVKPGLAQNVLLSLGGVIQQPGVDYTISGSGITFTTPPVSGTTFFATVLGDAQSVGTPSDGTVTPASIAAGFDFAFPNVNVTGVTTIASGSAATPSLSITGDADTGIFSPAANTIAVTTSGVQRLHITSSGNIGIGTTSPSNVLSLDDTQASGGVGIDITNQGDGGSSTTPYVFINARLNPVRPGGEIRFGREGVYGSESTADSFMAFYTAVNSTNTERLRIDSSGRLLIGTTSSQGLWNNSSGDDHIVQVESASSAFSQSWISHSTSQTAGVQLDVGRSRGTSNGSTTLVSSGDLLGHLCFQGADGSQFVRAALIQAHVDGTPAADDMPGRLTFHTTADGASTPTERMRLDSSGCLGIAATDADNTNEGAGLQCRKYISRNQYYSPAGSYAASFGYTNNSDSASWVAIDSNYNQGSAVSAGLFLSAFHQDANSSGCGSTIKNLRSGNALTFSTVVTASSTGNPAVETERMRIDSSGRLFVGTTSVIGGGTYSKLHLVDASGPEILFGRNDSSVTDGNSLGGIRLYGNDGGSYQECAHIMARADGTHANNDKPTRLVFSTTASGGSSATERMRIDSLGIVKLTQSGNNPRFGSLEASGDAFKLKAFSGNASHNATMQFFTGNNSPSERMRIDSSGRLLYGHSTSRTIYGIQAPVQIEGTQFESGSLSITCNNASDFPILLLARSRGSSNGSNVAPTDGQVIGEVSFVPSDGTNMGAASVRLQGVADDNHAENDVPGRFVIQVVPDGSESSAEKFRLHNNGKLSVVGVHNSTTTGGNPVYVEADGDLLRYTSSLKYKTDVETIEDARADAILNCRPVWYRSKCDNDIKTEGSEKSDWGWYGFIAEEVAEIEPRLVNWATKDAVKQENGLNRTVERDPADYSAEGVRYDNFVPLLVNLVKRQKARIEALETQQTDLLARVAALES